jgi:peptidyl-prolyl cis-trans isomerase D
VKGQFGTMLLHVGKIEPGEQKSYEQVAAEIKRSIAEARAKTQIETLRDKIEDERAAGSTLVEVAGKLGLTVRVVEAVDRSGRGLDGRPVPDLPQQPNVVSPAFATEVGVDDEALQLPGGGYLYYSVTGITPSRERTLDEVNDQVAQRWREDEIARRLKTKSEEMVDKLKAGTTLAQLASEAGMQVQTASDLQRGKQAGFIPPKVVEAAFQAPVDAVASSEGKDQTERYVLRVTGATDPTFNPDSEQGKAITQNLLSSYSDDVTGQYLAHLQNEFGVTFNQSAVNQAIGAARQ